jgi:hypothetical protein
VLDATALTDPIGDRSLEALVVDGGVDDGCGCCHGRVLLCCAQLPSNSCSDCGELGETCSAFVVNAKMVAWRCG